MPNEGSRDTPREATTPSGRPGKPPAIFLRPPGATDSGFKVPTGRTTTVGRDELNSVQIAHQSVEEFHLRLTVREVKSAPTEHLPQPSSTWVLVMETVGDATVVVGGKRVRGRFRLPWGREVTLGQITLQAVAEAAAPAEDDFRAELLREVKRVVPTWGGSLVLHLLLVLWLREVVWLEREETRTIALRSGHVDEPITLLERREESLDLVPSEEPELPDEPDVSALMDAPDVAEANVPAPLDLGRVNPSNLGMGRSSAAGGGLSGGRVLDLPGGASRGGGGGGFADTVAKMRGAGVDVVFLVDTTSSMRPFLTGARATIDQTVTKLAAVVQDLRMGVVAFRDRGANEEYLTQRLDLSADRYEIFNFLEGLDAAGGGNIPEAVDEGMEVAFEETSWRPGAHRVVVLVGDAPPHEQSWNALRSRVRRFADDGTQAHVSAVFVGDLGGASFRSEETIETFQEIARVGKGSYVSLRDAGDVERRLLLMTLGNRFEGELDHMLERMRSGAMEATIRRHRDSEDVPWLLDKFAKSRPPVHPDLVNALRALASPAVLHGVRDVFLDESRPVSLRRAARYILAKELEWTPTLNLLEPNRRQMDAVRELSERIQRYSAGK